MEQEQAKEVEEDITQKISKFVKKDKKLVKEGIENIKKLGQAFNKTKEVIISYKELLKNFRSTGKLDHVEKLLRLLNKHPYNFAIMNYYKESITAIGAILDQEIGKNKKLRELIYLDTEINKRFIKRVETLDELSKKLQINIDDIFEEFKKEQKKTQDKIITQTNYKQLHNHRGDIENIQERVYEVLGNIKQEEYKNIELLFLDSNAITQYDERLIKIIKAIHNSIIIQKDILDNIKRNGNRIKNNINNIDKEETKKETYNQLGQLKEEMIRQLTYIDLYAKEQGKKETLLEQVRIALQEMNIFIKSSRIILQRAA